MVGKMGGFGLFGVVFKGRLSNHETQGRNGAITLKILKLTIMSK
ncbi:hypothetical protein BSPWISOXPB_10186 [uncultured Gammaproteobacteria bacterium]|nr:hypothetical protein BSPWISOXPB_10186 [uncultured Gammaproteobacteria bacterium]